MEERMGRWLPRASFAVGAASTLLLVASASRAQDDQPAKPAATVSASTPIAPANATAAAGGTDHDMWVGHLGVGWYGVGDLPVPSGTTALVNPADPNSPFVLTPGDMGRTRPAPAIGVRYWLNPQIGIDAALGFSMSSGTHHQDVLVGAPTPTSTASVDNDLESYTAFLLHGGVPIALGNGQHFSFQITPELNVGFASGKWKPAKTAVPPGGTAPPLPPDVDESGFLLQLGARAGAEIYFGFIGLPQLALDASVGAYFQTESAKVSSGSQSDKISATTIATSNIHDPWDIFKSTIAARYYF
jgi:hypothetical protein